MRALLPFVFAALLACGTRATQEPCPGTPQGTFRVVGELVEGAACAETGGAAARVDLAVTLSYTGDTGAALCIQTPLAEPLVGTRDGDLIDVSAPLRSGSARGCACTVQLLERVSGTLLREGGVPIGFAGELTTELSPEDGSVACPPADDRSACDVPCSVRWTLTTG